MCGGGHAWQREGACVAGGACMVGDMHDRGTCVARGACMVCMPPCQILQDTVNEQVVCILLECILVTPVCDSVHRGRCIPACNGQGGVQGVYTPRQAPPRQTHTPPPGQTLHPQEMATEVGGVHPTGMHSCYELSCSLQAGLGILCKSS